MFEVVTAATDAIVDDSFFLSAISDGRLSKVYGQMC